MWGNPLLYDGWWPPLIPHSVPSGGCAGLQIPSDHIRLVLLITLTPKSHQKIHSMPHNLSQAVAITQNIISDHLMKKQIISTISTTFNGLPTEVRNQAI